MHTHANRLCIFDDGRGDFGPLTRLRAAFSMRTGAHNNRVRLETTLGIMARDLIVAPAVAPIYAEHETDARTNQPLRRKQDLETCTKSRDGRWAPQTIPGDTAVLLVNGRWAGCIGPTAEQVLALRPGQAITQADGLLLAAYLAIDDAQACIDAGFAAPANAAAIDTDVLLARPWHILDQLEATLAFDLARVTRRIADDAAVHPSAVLDETRGPVVVGPGATVGALAVLEGPCCVGRKSVVGPGALIRANTTVGEVCKVAGEVSFSVIDHYSNKAHAGFLGHAVVGRWVNLGADTTASNLKNTYGRVRVQLAPDAPPQDTCRTFCGPVIGDYVRTAIGSRLTTGAVLGTGAMFAASAFTPKHVGACTFTTDAGVAPADADKLVATARAMMARRDQTLGAAVERRLRDLCAAAGC